MFPSIKKRLRKLHQKIFVYITTISSMPYNLSGTITAMFDLALYHSHRTCLSCLTVGVIKCRGLPSYWVCNWRWCVSINLWNLCQLISRWCAGLAEYFGNCRIMENDGLVKLQWSCWDMKKPCTNLVVWLYIQIEFVPVAWVWMCRGFSCLG